MSTTFWIMLLKPFGALIVFGLICLPGRLAVEKWVPEGRLKRVLLFKLKR
jgi:hypothetical protein